MIWHNIKLQKFRLCVNSVNAIEISVAKLWIISENVLLRKTVFADKY